jgi:O-Antigen ligase
MHSKVSAKENYFINLQNRPAWKAILGFILVVVISLPVKLGIVVYPLAAISVGLFFYKRYPAFYVSFTLWLYFLTPFVGRLISYLGGSKTGGVGATPLLITWISFLTLLRNFPKIVKNKDKIGLAFILCFGSILYSLFIRWIQNPSPGVFQAEMSVFLGPLAPILLGFFIYSKWQEYPIYRTHIYQTFLWGVLVMGGYGVLQFLLAPPWDTLSMLSTANENTEVSWVGRPEPLGIRVFSTMTGPFTFALNLMPGLILLNIGNNKLRYIAAAFGYFSFMFSTVRTAWYSWLIAMMILIISVKGQRLVRMLASFVIIAVILTSIGSIEPFSSFISENMLTRFSNNMADDGSAIARIEQTQIFSKIIISEFIGKGFDVGDIYLNDNPSSSIRFFGTDNGLMQFPLQLGWFGTIPYLSGMIIICWKLFSNSTAHIDVFTVAARAIVLAQLFRVVTQTILHGEYALSLWIFIGISMSAYRYYLHRSHLEKMQLSLKG